MIDDAFVAVVEDKAIIEEAEAEIDAAYAEIRDKLKAELLQLKQEIGDTDEKYPELMKVREQYWD